MIQYVMRLKRDTFASSVLLLLAAEFFTVFNHKLGFSFFFFFLNGLEIPFFFLFYYMCEVSWVFPTPRLGRYLIRTGFDFFLSLSLSCVCFGVLFGINFGCWTNIFFIAFKNINNIVKEGKVQFYWNKLLKTIYYKYTIFF